MQAAVEEDFSGRRGAVVEQKKGEMLRIDGTLVARGGASLHIRPSVTLLSSRMTNQGKGTFCMIFKIFVQN